MEVLGWLSVPCGGAGFAWWFCWRCLGALVSLVVGFDSVGVLWKVVHGILLLECWERGYCWISVDLLLVGSP